VSCIAGLFNFGGESLAPMRIEQMLLPMKPRAPDGEQVVRDGRIGFGHLWLRTGTSGAEGPFSIAHDADAWIVADARIDARAELIRKLRSRGRDVSDEAAHAALVLHAYRAFGGNFMEHLIGDFAFAIWDARLQQLVCARDHFGVRPFHYFDAGNEFGFASDVDALLTQPQVTRELDDASVADFLLFGSLQDEDRTIYRDVRCLPPASIMTVSSSGSTLRRYWELPTYEQVRFADPSDYAHAYRHVFEQAVADRLPQGPVALQLSGGVDSTAIAAVAATQPGRPPASIEAYTFACRDLVPQDDESHYAQLTASHLGISWSAIELGAYSLFERSQEHDLRVCEPFMYPFLAAQGDVQEALGRKGARILLSGQGGDALMTPSAAYYQGLLRNRQWGQLTREVAHHFRYTGSLAGMGLRSALSPKAGPRRQRPALPDWLDPAFAKKVDLEARWERGWRVLHDGRDPYAQLRESWVRRQFDALEVLKLPIVGRYPFYDLRLVEFSLGLPNFMRKGKHVVRLAMRDKLPPAVLQRPKLSLPGDFVRAIVTRGNEQRMLAEKQAEGLPAPLNGPKYSAALQRYSAGEGAASAWTSSLIITGLAFRNWISQR
jgi:asparagine synthase (glutamine-hydrolysing)